MKKTENLTIFNNIYLLNSIEFNPYDYKSLFDVFSIIVSVRYIWFLTLDKTNDHRSVRK